VKQMAFKKKEVKPKVEKTQRLVAKRNIDRYKTLGYKVVKEDVRDKQGKVLGTRHHANELVLMEK